MEVCSMIIEIRAKNCFIFNEEIVFSMKADMRNKKFASNVHTENNFNVLKVAGVYGPNNVGKTCLIKCIGAIKQILLNKKIHLGSNFLTKSNTCELGVTFLNDGKKYSYDFHYNVENKEFLYEKFSELLKDKYGNEKEEVWLVKDTANEEYYSIDEDMSDMFELMSKNGLICHMLDSSNFKHLEQMKFIITEFAQKIDIVNMNNIPLEKTIQLLKNQDNLQKKVAEFVKNADLYMDNFELVSADKIKINAESIDSKPDEKALFLPEQVVDQMRLVSTYKGVSVPSIVFDSTGTKKIAAIASYIIEALEQGRILVVDELDSSIHFKLTRAIVAMFNNELNRKAQMIFSIHDINLMDCKKMFRKEQIWFIDKEDEGVYLYSLADFTAQKGVRDTSDVIEKYRKGVLGAIPEPDLIRSLLSLVENEKGDSTNGKKNKE